MLFMLYIKAREVKRGTPSFISKVGNGTDHVVHGVYDRFKFWFDHLDKRTAIGVLQWIAFHVLSWAKNGYEWMHSHAHRNPHSKKVIDMVKGRADNPHAHKGAASVFLKRIAKGTDDVIQ